MERMGREKEREREPRPSRSTWPLSMLSVCYMFEGFFSSSVEITKTHGESLDLPTGARSIPAIR